MCNTADWSSGAPGTQFNTPTQAVVVHTTFTLTFRLVLTCCAGMSKRAPSATTVTQLRQSAGSQRAARLLPTACDSTLPLRGWSLPHIMRLHATTARRVALT